MNAWGTMITTLIGDAKTPLLSIFVAIGTIRIIIEAIKYKNGTDDEKLSAFKNIKSNLGWFIGLPFALWLAVYIYGKASGVTGSTTIELKTAMIVEIVKGVV